MMTNAVPGEYLTDAQFANMLREAERYRIPFMSGEEAKPSTSF